MANRNTLSVNQLEAFKAWLIAYGWQVKVPKGDYEVLRAFRECKKYPLIVYKRFDTNGGKELVHYTVLDRDMEVVRAFLRSRNTEGGV